MKAPVYLTRPAREILRTIPANQRRAMLNSAITAAAREGHSIVNARSMQAAAAVQLAAMTTPPAPRKMTSYRFGTDHHTWIETLPDDATALQMASDATDGTGANVEKWIGNGFRGWDITAQAWRSRTNR